uniref:acid phosphatase n=1 Tax=Angiostrongylus cantonensis TaxID=6313 RepID=A0A0K0DQL4_ANGCA
MGKDCACVRSLDQLGVRRQVTRDPPTNLHTTNIQQLFHSIRFLSPCYLQRCSHFYMWSTRSSDRTLMMNNLDIGQEIQKVRGGSLFNDINSRMNAKLDCINSASPKCIWIKPLKYYVYSAHDTTVYAFLSVMGIEERVVWPSGFPAYSAGVFIELWMNRTDSQPYFKNGLNDTLNPITHFIGACGCTTVYCKLDVFRNFAARTKPDESMETVSWHALN